MAEMAEGSSGGHKKGGKKPRGKKHSTRIDMTPMVDLGFLLVTFFIFTTTLSKPTTMELLMPSKDKPPNTDVKANCEEVIVLLLGDKNRVFYYQPPCGDESPEVKVANFSTSGPKSIRTVLQENKKRVARDMKKEKDKDGKPIPHRLTVIIKPTDKSTYGNFVDILDEMNISDIAKFVTVDPEPSELEMVATAEATAEKNSK